MSKAQTDIRTTSYDAATANPHGYVGTIDDVLAQIRAEADVPARNKGRAELLKFLGVTKPRSELSGRQRFVDMPMSYVYPNDWTFGADLDHVEYGAPELPAQPWDQFSPFSLEYAMARWPDNFRSTADTEGK